MIATTLRTRLRVAGDVVIVAAFALGPTLLLLASAPVRNGTAVAGIFGATIALGWVLALLLAELAVLAGWLTGRYGAIVNGANALAVLLGIYAVLLVADRPARSLLIATVMAAVAVNLVRRAGLLTQARDACT